MYGKTSMIPDFGEILRFLSGIPLGWGPVLSATGTRTNTVRVLSLVATHFVASAT